MRGVAGFPGDGFSVAGSRGKWLGAVSGVGVLESVECEDTMFTWGPVVGDEKQVGSELTPGEGEGKAD